MLSAPPPASPRASVHEDIRRAVVRQLDQRWHALWGSFGMSIILMGFGAELAWHRWDAQWTSSLALLAAGAILWLVHRQQALRWHHSLGGYNDWLSKGDQCLVAVGLLAAVMAPAGQWWWPLPLLAGSAWGVLRMSLNAQAHWAHWHFVVARQVLRERRRSSRTPTRAP